MLQLLVALLLAAPGPGPGDRMVLRDPQQGPTPVTDKWILPPKVKDCRTPEEEAQALDQRAHGDQQVCNPVNADKQRQR